MSDDPETARQIAALSLDTRPLLVLDVDDVLLEFIRPFIQYLDSKGYALNFDSFRLHGNIRHIQTSELAANEIVSDMIASFFDEQAMWQTVTDGAGAALAGFGDAVEIVLLTAMPHRHRDHRLQHLKNIGLPYPLVTTESAKGPALASLRGDSGRPIAFVDDMPHNLSSARKALPDAHLFSYMAMPALRKLLPPVAEDVVAVDDWLLAGPMIADALGVSWTAPAASTDVSDRRIEASRPAS